jgi:hypothetical protein
MLGWLFSISGIMSPLYFGITWQPLKKLILKIALVHIPYHGVFLACLAEILFYFKYGSHYI